MRILLVGVDHKTAPLQIREVVSFSKEQTSLALPDLQRRIGEAVILSTCNRTEVYAAAANPEAAAEHIGRFIVGFHGLPRESIAPHLNTAVDGDVAQHLFRVASGLDSMIVGEPQILGQVRDALATASNADSVGAALNGLFHAAVKSGRRVREETEISRNPLSISYAGVRLAKRELGGLEGRRVLLVGAGDAGRLVAVALRSSGVRDLQIANRTMSRSEDLAAELSGAAVPFEEIPNALKRVDIVISATDAPEYILSTAMVSDALHSANGSGGRLFMFDLAVPRDVEPSVAELPKVRLFNIDDLSSIAEDNLQERKRAAQDAERIVEDELARFGRWWDSLDSEAMVRSMRMRAEDIRQQEIERALRHLMSSSDGDRDVMEAMTRSIVNRLLHDPTMFLKHKASTAQLDAARLMFGLDDEEDR
ncbi:MAG: glutamyl-tRNA reductase [SAR202 cluster bacterium]|nr:glutamyl-tRNA reductase [SAR202 cluster bacterium]MDP6301884.1 glutamyl-tRNA reductase [SAR202 cluster bacterium]MDP7105215.1 glutamyl-tRNA reductase [SAR202 cluster bacterium]MDP7226539.1 glutamyl-tRNA reductase [SAR202 cluster bacterium]MDP7412589.1 glutamyl-tRNA reductase [SAR202 cluster bacterium]